MTYPVAIQRCDTFVSRTQNWMYDHLRFVLNYTPLVLCDALENREEFPELEAWLLDREELLWRSVDEVDRKLSPSQGVLETETAKTTSTAFSLRLCGGGRSSTPSKLGHPMGCWFLWSGCIPSRTLSWMGS